MQADVIFEELTAKLIDKLEHVDDSDWRCPWHFTGNASVFRPTNASTRKPYQGSNVIGLWLAAEDAAYTTGWWATYKQWAALGAQVRKGEKGTSCVKWATRVVKDDDGEVARSFLIPVGFSVFNSAQVDNWTEPEVEPGPEPIAAAETFFTAVGATVRPDVSAHYSPAGDYIGMPPLDTFTDAGRYYGVLGHEHTHWTGAAARLDRDLKGRFGTESYAAEELVAELGAAFLCAQLGIDNEPRDDHAQYLANWLTILRNDPKAVLTASSLAQRAVTYLTEQTGTVPAVEQAA